MTDIALLSGLAMGATKAETYATGMIAGAVGLIVYCGAAALLVKHLGAVVGSGLGGLPSRSLCS